MICRFDELAGLFAPHGAGVGPGPMTDIGQEGGNDGNLNSTDG